MSWNNKASSVSFSNSASQTDRASCESICEISLALLLSLSNRADNWASLNGSDVINRSTFFTSWVQCPLYNSHTDFILLMSSVILSDKYGFRHQCYYSYNTKVLVHGVYWKDSHTLCSHAL